MGNLRREPIKYIRDFIKKDYKARDCCYICASTVQLDLHHLYSVSELFTQWCAKNSIASVDTEEQIKELRVLFATDCAASLSNDNLYTLCKKHHLQLHNIYGQKYSNHMAIKVKNWIEVQRNKANTNN
jgi:5-methylcytosine-specific restriction endonuclease McrA